MAGLAPKGVAPDTRDWRALENAHKPSGFHIIVHGLVQVPATNIEPVLTESAERNPDNLGLTLTLKTGTDDGAEVVVWKSAFFHKEVEEDEFNHVNIRWEHERIAEVAVMDDREYEHANEKAMATVNAKYGKAPKANPAAAPAAPKKAAAKKASAKKAAVKRAAAKTAKPAARKAKKAKKEAAKKSTLTRLVRGLVKRLTPKKARKPKKAKAQKKKGAR